MPSRASQYTCQKNDNLQGAVHVGIAGSASAMDDWHMNWIAEPRSLLRDNHLNDIFSKVTQDYKSFPQNSNLSSLVVIRRANVHGAVDA